MTPRMITVHCSANSNGSRCTGEDIRRYHKAPPPEGRGWSDIGYHGVIEIDGGFFQGRSDITLGAHVEGHNDGNLGICLIGDTKFTMEQFDALRWWAQNKMAAYNIPLEEIRGHYEFDTAKAQGKTCPNIPTEVLRDWIDKGDAGILGPYLLAPRV